MPANAVGTSTSRSRSTPATERSSRLSPLTRALTIPACPSGASSSSGLRNTASSRSAASRRSAAALTPGEDVSPSITISTSSTVPTPNSSSSRTNPCLEANRSGSVRIPGKPVGKSSTGTASAISTAVETSADRSGARITPRTTRDHTRPSAPALRSIRRPSHGSRTAFTRSPSSERRAGRSVSAASTETIPTRIAPAARLRRIVSGTSTIPIIARTNAVPLKSTARHAVLPATPIASSFARPPLRSSR